MKSTLQGIFLGFVFLSITSLSAIAQQAVAQGTFDGPAELPRVYVKSSLADTPSPGKVRMVKATDNLQDALDDAACGETLRLQSGATFSGRFVLRAKKCDDSKWITIRTSAADSVLPPEGSRLTPCYAGIASLPGRPAFSCSAPQNVMAKIEFPGKGVGPVLFASGANHYRFVGLEITRAGTPDNLTSLVSLERDAVADHLVFDRVWIHGLAQEETARGIQLGGSTYVAVVDSYFSDFHCIAVTGACVDSQAIAGGGGSNPMGPYKIVNNFLEAAAEDIIFGGSFATVTPADIEIRHNHMFRPLSWKPGSPDFVGARNGRPFIVKNVFELKNAQRLLLEGNIMENTWGGFSQLGFAIVLTPKNQAPNVCPLCRVTDVTVRFNRVAHMASGMQIANALSDTGGASTEGGRYSIHDNLFEDMDGPTYKGNSNFAQVYSRAPQLHDVTIDHNTAFPANALLNVGAEVDGPKISNFVFTNNLVNAGQRQIVSTGGRTNCAFEPERQGPSGVLSSCFPNYKFSHNAIIGGSGFPKDNNMLKNLGAVGFAGLEKDRITDYHLRPDSRCRQAGSDKKDIGADIGAIEAATAGAQ